MDKDTLYSIFKVLTGKKKAVSSNCLSRKFCDQQDRMLFFKSPKRHLRTGLIYLQLKATSLSICTMQYVKSVYGGNPTEVDRKKFLSPDR